MYEYIHIYMYVYAHANPHIRKHLAIICLISFTVAPFLGKTQKATPNKKNEQICLKMCVPFSELLMLTNFA